MNGNFPYGLLKRMPNFQFGNQIENKNLINLKNLISSAEYRLSVSNKKTYENQVVTKAALQTAIDAAKLIAQKSSPTELEVKNAYDALKAAVELFDGKELVGETYYNKLKELKAKLDDYRVKFMVTYDDKVPALVQQLKELDELIARINKYLGADKGKMTLAAYNEIVEDAKAFEDYFQNLVALIDEAKKFIFNSNGTLKISIGNTEGKYQEVHVNQFIAEIAIAENVVKAVPPKSIAEVNIAFNNLKNAFDTFKLRKVLGTESMTTFKLLYNELVDAKERLADGALKVELVKILGEMDLIITKPLENPLTQEVMNKYIEAAKAYLPNLYTAIVNDIKALIVIADDMILKFVETYANFDDADKTILEGLKNVIKTENDKAKAYVLVASPTYAKLNEIHDKLEDAINAFNQKVADFTLVKKNTLSAMVVDFNKFITDYDLEYKQPEYTEDQLAQLLPLKNTVKEKTDAAKAYLDAEGAKTYLELKAHILAMNVAMKAFNDKVATF